MSERDFSRYEALKRHYMYIGNVDKEILTLEMGTEENDVLETQQRAAKEPFFCHQIYYLCYPPRTNSFNDRKTEIQKRANRHR